MVSRVTLTSFFCLCFTFILLKIVRPATAETIRLEREGGAYLVPVRINDAITLNFVLDTGAADVAILADVFLTLARTGTVKKSDFIGKGTYVLADGSEQPSDRFVLHELRVGDHIIRNVIANVAPVKGDPLLGQSFLSKLPAWTIDNQRHVLVLGPVSGEQSAAISPPSPGALLSSGSVTDQFNYAFGLMRQGNWAAAEQAWMAFVQRHPNDPLAGPAKYWLGEAYYARSMFIEAAGVFAEGYKRYPNSSKAADDLLKLGMALARANQPQQACSALAQLDHDFPSPSAVIKERARDEKKKLGC